MIINNITEVNTLLQQAKNIVITTHFKPDGDAIGSTMGLYHVLKQLNKNVTVIIPSALPDFLSWIPDVNIATINYELNKDRSNDILSSSDIVFCLDFNKFSRVQQFTDSLTLATQPKVLIDHHIDPSVSDFTFIYSDDSKSSTCEMVYDFIKMMEWETLINDDVMKSLYTGLMTDTGSFRFPATSASVHDMVADFKRRGMNHTYIHEAVYDVWAESRMRLLGYLLSEKMTIDYDNSYGYIYVTKDDLIKYKANLGDTEGIVNYIYSIKGIKVGILATEREEGIKLSFRSKGNINVNNFANTYFNGGGHFNAAGATSPLGWNETLKIIQDNLPSIIN